MQVRIPQDSIRPILDNAECEISQESEKQIAAWKHWKNGRIQIRLRRYTARYTIKEHYYWLANIHFEKGLGSNRTFDSIEVRGFVERFVKPFIAAFHKKEKVSLQIDGSKALKLHEKEQT